MKYVILRLCKIIWSVYLFYVSYILNTFSKPYLKLIYQTHLILVAQICKHVC